MQNVNQYLLLDYVWVSKLLEFVTFNVQHAYHHLTFTTIPFPALLLLSEMFSYCTSDWTALSHPDVMTVEYIYVKNFLLLAELRA